MPLDISAFAAETREMSVETSMGPLAIRYRPNAMTPVREAELAKAGTESENLGAILEMFCDLITWADIEGPLYDPSQADEKGQPLQVWGEGNIPIEPEYVGLLPSRLFTSILTSIREDMTGGPDPKPRRAGSLNGSSRA